jgi:hypothetical protein
MPTNLAVDSSATSIKIRWTEPSKNAKVFVIFRNGSDVAYVSGSHNTFTDTDLRPATQYDYSVIAVNLAGQSQISSLSTKTLNPPITVTIFAVGVHENGQEGVGIFNAQYGNVDAAVFVTDDKTNYKTRLPSKGYYELRENDQTSTGVTVFTTAEVGDNLSIAVIGNEHNGNGLENFLADIAGWATNEEIVGFPWSLLTGSAGADDALGDMYKQLAGLGDHPMGNYVAQWNVDNNWGVGTYSDIGCTRPDGQVGLRLWIQITCPVYDYANESTNATSIDGR